MIIMEIEIRSQHNNPLLNRTEIHFVIRHQGEGTPRRELIRSELADQLKTKKDLIIIDHMKSGFGSHETIGYAKMYSSVEKAQQGEHKYIMKRNSGGDEQKKAKGETKQEEPEDKPAQEEQPAEKAEDADEPKEEPAKDEGQEEKKEE